MSDPIGSPNQEIPFTHVLKKTGLLRSFGVAKVVRGKELRELKGLIKMVAKDKDEYNQMLQEELEKLANTNNGQSIPGVIFLLGDYKKSATILTSAKIYAKKLKQTNWSKEQICFYILALIKELGLSQSDFDEVIKQQLDQDDGEDFDDDDDLEDGEDDEGEDIDEN